MLEICWPNALIEVLSRLTADPPNFSASEVDGGLREVLGPLITNGVLQASTPDGSFTCAECGERAPVEYIRDERSGDYRGYMQCPCGISQVRRESLRRWSLDVAAFVRVIFAPSIGIEVVPGHLWRLERAAWAGRRRAAYFARNHSCCSGALETVRGRKKGCIVFVPTEDEATKWQGPHSVISLASVLNLDESRVSLDAETVVDFLSSSGHLEANQKPPAKRAARAADIEALEQELIEHILAARDNAFAKKKWHGVAELLEKPLKKDLAKRLSISRSTVTRCFQDSRAEVLNMLWKLADDLDGVMRYKAPKNRGAKRT